jgi:hypothetical protein
MSHFGNTLFSGSRFIFWSLGPVLFLGGLSFLGLAIWAFPGGGQTSRLGLALLGLFCLVCVPVLYDPTRFRLASRVLTGVVFLVYLGYFISEWIWHSNDIGLGKPRSAQTPLNATLGLLVIGLPCLWWTLFGRFSLRQAPGSGPSGSESAPGG